jgi:hypothetical protein
LNGQIVKLNELIANGQNEFLNLEKETSAKINALEEKVI